MSTIVTKMNLLSAITATTSSQPIALEGVKKATVEFTEGGVVLNRSGVLTITVSVDGGATYRAFSQLIDNVTNTNAQNLTRVASKTRAAAGTDILAIDLSNFCFTHIKATVTVSDGATPTGNFTVKLLTEEC